MAYVKIVDGAVAEYPYPLSKLRGDFPNTFFADGDYSSVGVFEVKPPKAVDYDPTLNTLEYAQQPSLVDGEWSFATTIRPFTQEELDQQAQSKRAEFVSTVVSATEARLMSFAASRAYDSVDSANKYKDIDEADIALLPEAERAYVMKFKAESKYIVLATARTWAKLYTILDEVNAGTRAMPQSLEEVMAELPELAWPVI